ncbi:hypothetical protein LTR99_011131 [Exophiala xenobiotica]|nr:hypothetical protein LTR99_011131 [Exophiala xenobiotica]KAK5310929.1 hypothetical protein LTR93_011879 [Exophiala xenobiotica]KAK5432346.1 hypothetical protein LTR18_011135 [Exophiala xenobiotica]
MPSLRTMLKYNNVDFERSWHATPDWNANSGGWQRRLWTLQEACVAQHLIFLFQDIPFDFEKWTHITHEAVFYVMANVVTPSLVAEEIFRHLRSALGGGTRNEAVARIMQSAFNKVDGQSTDPIMPVYLAVQERSTSHEGDQWGCLATLLDFGPAKMMKLLNCPRDGRIFSFLNLQNTYPASLIFLDGAK